MKHAWWRRRWPGRSLRRPDVGPAPAPALTTVRAWPRGVIQHNAIAYTFALPRAADDRLSGGPRTLTGMACRISELVIEAADPDRLAAFWSEVLGYVELAREDDGSIEIGPSDVGFGGPQPTLILSPSSEPRAGKLRLHIDVNATDRDQDAELERLLALGARPADVGQTGTENWHVLADPEGNEFCLLHTRLKPL